MPSARHTFVRGIWRHTTWDYDYVHNTGGDGYGYGRFGDGESDGHGYGGVGDGDGDGAGDGDGCSANNHYHDSGAAYGGRPSGPLPMTRDDRRRTERILRCAGCIGGFECPLHGRRL